MRPIQHRTNNGVLGAPPGVSIEECKALPVTRARYDNGPPVVLSYWQPAPDELARLNRGEPVVLEIVGTTHAPVYVGVGEP